MRSIIPPLLAAGERATVSWQNPATGKWELITPTEAKAKGIQTMGETAATKAEASGLRESLVSRVKAMEGFEPVAKWDVKQWSVGHGTVGYPGQTITREQADTALRAELAMHQARIDQAAKAKGMVLTPGQRDALTSFDFNTGKGVDLIATSASTEEIARRIPLYRKAGGEVMPGLINRRAQEMEMFRGASLRDMIKGIGRPAQSLASTTNFSNAPVINIGSVAPGKEQLVAEAVRRELDTSTRALLAKMKQARNHEARLGYV